VSAPASVPLAAARRWYDRELRALVRSLRASFESGELRGWISGDGDQVWGPRSDPPFFKLEDITERRICRTMAQACLVLAVSPSAAWSEWAPAENVRQQASSAAARDVLLLARRLGWSRRLRGEGMPYGPVRNVSSR
jgi:hypothetical protein